MLEQDGMSAIKDSFAAVHLSTPSADVLARGRAIRRHRRAPVVSIATLVACAGAALGLGYGRSGPAHYGLETTVVTGSSLPKVALAAWTVKRIADGTVSVTVRQMSDVEGLQAALRDDGVRSIVTASLAFPPGCTSFDGGQYMMGDVVTTATRSGLPDTDGLELLIRPALVPPGALLWLGLAQSGAPAGSPGPAGPTATGYMVDTPSCANA